MSTSKTYRDIEVFDPPDREAWRGWLSKNHAFSKGVWLIITKKHSGKKGITLEDAVEEALCFGWIDSKLNVVDEKCFRLLLTPRKPRSIWSKINKQRVEKLHKQGLITNAGLKKVHAAREDGSWNILDAVEEPKVPADLAKALVAEKNAQKNFESFSNSTKKQTLWWIESAKTQQTRSTRIEKVVNAALENKKDRVDS